MPIGAPLSTSAQANATSLTINRPGASAADVEGRVAFAVITVVTQNADVDRPITAPSGWTLISDLHDPDGPGVRTNVYWKLMASEGASYQFTTGAVSGGIVGSIHAYPGVNTTTPVVGSEKGIGTGTSSATRTTPSITTAGARWILSYFSDRSGSTWTGPDTERVEERIASSASQVVCDSNADVAAGTISRTATASVATSTRVEGILAINPAAGQTVTMGRPAEVDTARTVRARKVTSIGLVVETESTRSANAAKVVRLSHVVEVDAARTIGADKAKRLGRAAEVETARQVTADKAVRLGRSTEADTSRRVGVAKVVRLGRATETDVARTLTDTSPNVVALGRAVEADAARTVRAAKVIRLGRATEADRAHGLAGGRPTAGSARLTERIGPHAAATARGTAHAAITERRLAYAQGG